MKPDHDTLEMVGMLEVMRATVPARRSAAIRGITPRSVSASMSGAPTPSRPITATRGFGFAFLKRSKRPTRPRSACPRRGPIDHGCQLLDRLYRREVVGRPADLELFVEPRGDLGQRQGVELGEIGEPHRRRHRCRRNPQYGCDDLAYTLEGIHTSPPRRR